MKNKKRVLKIQSPFENIKKYGEDPISNLYRAVIMQMIIDASNISKNKELMKLQKIAHEWLFEDNEDFDLVCIHAKLSKDRVRKSARQLIEGHREKNE
ncbi:MAG UNVERIFIED_CONTAM: hypothetical protein LVQ98_02675 [Rickettsiaceae bacterium]|jgi:thiamine monophosphate kinase